MVFYKMWLAMIVWWYVYALMFCWWFIGAGSGCCVGGLLGLVTYVDFIIVFRCFACCI